MLGLLLYLGLGYFADTLTHESTDNAFLDAEIVAIGSKISGNVSKVWVNENQLVKRGDLLLEIDPRDVAVRLAQKKAAHSAAEANIKLVRASFDMLRSQVDTAEAKARESDAEAASDKATADRAASDLKRAEDLYHKNITSQQEYEASRAAAESAAATYNAGRQKAASDQSKVAEAKAQLEAGYQALERTQAQTKEAEVDEQEADLNLSYAKIVAPEDGRVTRKAVESGDYIEVGQRLMALVPTNIWVTGNFKETQLKRIRVNQPAEITIDSVSGRTYHGHVESIQAGSGARFSLLPAENAVGNYVKVVQRIPVKIVFDEVVASDHVLGPGMSVVPSIKVTSYEIPAFAIALAAGVLALIGGFFWIKLAKGNGEKLSTANDGAR